LEPGYVVLGLPLPPSKNREPSNRWARRKLKKEFEKSAYDAWCAAGMPRFESIVIVPRFCCWGERDQDNHNGVAFKGILDGLKGHLVPDDAPRYLELCEPECEIDRGLQRLELHIFERRPWINLDFGRHDTI